MKLRSKARNLRAGKSNPRVTIRSRGFTLIEMVVVMFIILIILSIAVPNYTHSVLLAKEATLHQNLSTLNKVIQEYSLDKQKAPQSLQDLVAGYLKFVPNDITGSTDTWKTELEDSLKIHRPDPDRHRECPQRFRPSGHRWHPLFELDLLSPRADA